MALGNLYLEWAIAPQMWWIGVLHLPLLILSFTGLGLTRPNILPHSNRYIPA